MPQRRSVRSRTITAKQKELQERVASGSGTGRNRGLSTSSTVAPPPRSTTPSHFLVSAPLSPCSSLSSQPSDCEPSARLSTPDDSVTVKQEIADMVVNSDVDDTAMRSSVPLILRPPSPPESVIADSSSGTGTASSFADRGRRRQSTARATTRNQVENFQPIPFPPPRLRPLEEGQEETEGLSAEDLKDDRLMAVCAALDCQGNRALLPQQIADFCLQRGWLRPR